MSEKDSCILYTEREMKATFVWIVFLSFDILKQ